MTAATATAAARPKFLPRGWLDLFRQLLIWFGFLAVYQLARGIADRDPAQAFQNGLSVIELERRATHHVVELSLQRIADSSHLLASLASWTYWNSEFTVVGIALLWVYLRRHEAFPRFRNAILLANVLGLIGYVLLPTAPPRMFPDVGFVDTLAAVGTLNHGSGLIELASNPYAAMPSLHAADALIVGVTLAGLARTRIARFLWAAWPLWVAFCVMATANHFWLDVVAGFAVAVFALAVVYRERTRRVIAALL